MDKREHIIQKTIELFSENGFDNTSIREISNRAQVNVAMVNYYFGSKLKLFEAIMEYKSNYLKTRLEELQANTDLDEMEKIKVIIDEYATRILSNPHFHRVMHQELLLKTRPDNIAIIKKLFAKNYQIIRNILEEGIRKKIFRDVDSQLTISTLFGTINHYMQNAEVLGIQEGEKKEETTGHNEILRARLIDHLHSLMQAHLLKGQNK